MTDMTDEAVKALPDEIQVWRSTDTLDRIGTWSTTRYPPEAVTYVPKASASKLIRQHGEIARRNFLHLMEVEAERDRLRADAQAAVALALEQAVAALKPFADRVFYDNGDCTVSDTHTLKAEDFIRANRTIRALASADALDEVQRLREERDRLKALLTPPGDVPSVTIDAIVYSTFARDRFSGDEPLVPADALNAARAERDAALARVETLTERIRWAHETLWELNPSNYDHDEVCKANDAAVEVILGLAPIIGETHGYSTEWWADRANLLV